MRRFTRWPLAALLLVPVVAAGGVAGGWATITLHELPESLTPGEPVQLEFTVRQHGVELMPGLQPRVTARSGGREVVAEIERGRRSGTYAASFTPPATGDWTVDIHSGYHESAVTLLPITARRGGAQLVRQPLAERGRALFVAKGCQSCHLHGDVASSRRGSGPDLTGRRFDAGWLARFLDDPSIRPPANRNNVMPELELTPAEIAALVTFINNGGARVAGR